MAAKFAHFPGGGPQGAVCAMCAHRAIFQRTVKDGQGNLVPSGIPSTWCQKAADFIGARPRANGGKPKGVDTLSGATPACKYFTPAGPRPVAAQPEQEAAHA